MNKTRLIAARKPIQGLQRMYITTQLYIRLYEALAPLIGYELASGATNSTTLYLYALQMVSIQE